MTPRHHPSDETLLRHPAGTLQGGPGIIVAAHLEECPVCRRHAERLEALGGLLLEETESATLARDALVQTLARIDAVSDGVRPADKLGGAPVQPAMPDGTALPKSLEGQNIGPWRWLAPGVRCSKISLPGDAGTNLMLLKIAPNKRLLAHGHTGAEFTQVLYGCLTSGQDRYLPGDLMEADSHIDHEPIVDVAGECICLVGWEGRLRLHGLIGRMLQPLLRL